MTKIANSIAYKKKYNVTTLDDFYGSDSSNNNAIIRLDFEAVANLILSLDTSKKNYIEKISAEAIPSHTPIAIIGDFAYKLDASNSAHQFAFAGFSINGTSQDQYCHIQEKGEITLSGWGLTANAQYLCGASGTLILQNISPTNFTKIIGYARTSDTLEIIKDSITINK